MTTKPRKPMSAKDRKAFAGLVMVVFLIVLPVGALLSHNWGAAVGIFVAFWAGAVAMDLGRVK